MKRLILIATMILISLCVVPTALAQQREEPRVQIAILLDTSGSMEGLIEQAKSQLWRIVNEFATVKKAGARPTLEVALYEYGKNSIPQTQGYIRLILPLTTDLDRVSEELFALKTNGGDEYCGMVIQKSVEQLQWSQSPNDLKTIFIAGNEPFTQGPVDYRAACRAAISKGITVNTVHCETGGSADSTDWRNGALLADGSFTGIDHNRLVAHVAAPQDSEIECLGVRLNETYIPFGLEGSRGASNQLAQDSNAKQAPGNAVQRAVSKSTAHYKNSSWDLVDATRNGGLDLAKVKKEELPKEMQAMTADQRRTYVETKAKQRQEIQQRIQQLNEQRAEYVAQEMKKQAESGVQTLDSAIIKNVREQVAKKKFSVE